MIERAKNGDYLGGLGPAEVEVPGVRISVVRRSNGEVAISAKFRRNAPSSEVNDGLREIGIRTRRLAFVRQINAEARETLSMRPAPVDDGYGDDGDGDDQ